LLRMGSSGPNRRPRKTQCREITKIINFERGNYAMQTGSEEASIRRRQS
jgi:hypothetical protein